MTLSAQRVFKTGGFTLIELLVVISIIGLLATTLIANLSSMRGRARDSIRKSDLRQLTAALRLYFNDQGGYPCATGGHEIMACGAAGVSVCSWGVDPLTSRGGTNTYISIIPGDPVASTTTPYRYDVGGCSGAPNYLATSFILSADLENVSDQDISKSQAKCLTNFGGFITLANQFVLCTY